MSIPYPAEAAEHEQIGWPGGGVLRVLLDGGHTDGRLTVFRSDAVGGAVPAGEPVVVVIERAAAPDVTEMLALAHGLSPREREVTACVADGLPSARIAAEPHITVHTVQDHLKLIFAKFAVRSRAELLARLNRS